MESDQKNKGFVLFCTRSTWNETHTHKKKACFLTWNASTRISNSNPPLHVHFAPAVASAGSFQSFHEIRE